MIVIDNIIDVTNLLLYKEAIKRLENAGIEYDKAKLLNNPELCKEIIAILKYLEEGQ